MSLFVEYSRLAICTWPTPNHGAIWTDNEIELAKSLISQGTDPITIANTLGRRLDGVCIKMTQKGALYKDMHGNYHLNTIPTESKPDMTKTIEHKTFVNGIELKTATEDQLINMLSKIFISIDKLKDILGSGAYYDKQINEYIEAKDAITKELNTRV